jgi:hypothetical protein
MDPLESLAAAAVAADEAENMRMYQEYMADEQRMHQGNDSNYSSGAEEPDAPTSYVEEIASIEAVSARAVFTIVVFLCLYTLLQPLALGRSTGHVAVYLTLFIVSHTTRRFDCDAIIVQQWRHNCPGPDVQHQRGHPRAWTLPGF